MHPTLEECKELYALYKQTFAFDDYGSIDCYFKHAFSPNTTWILKDGDEIVSMLCAHPHVMTLDHVSLPIYFISGVITKETKRGKGYMNTLFQSLFHDTITQSALYVLQAYEPQIYKQLGFVPTHLIQSMQYHGPQTPSTLKLVTSPIELSTCALQALRYQNGWLTHDEAFYTYQLQEAHVQHHQFLGLYENDILYAFARCHQTGDTAIKLEELCAYNKQYETLFLSQLASLYSEISYPLACTKTSNCDINLLTKLGNQELCSKLFQKDIHSISDLFKKNQPYIHFGWW